MHGIPYVAQVGSLKALELSDNELIAVELDGALDGAGDGVGGATGQSLLELIGRLAQLGLQVLTRAGTSSTRHLSAVAAASTSARRSAI